MIDKDMPDLEKAVNEESWEWLQDNLPGMAQAVQKEVGRGHTPQAIRRHLMQRTGRQALAMRVEQAAAWLKEAGG